MRLVLFIICILSVLLVGCESRSSVEVANEQGVLILGNNSEPQSFDPHVATSVADGKIINAVMEGLLRGDARDDSMYHAGVALKWESNKLADEWSFMLRKDALWSDGTPLTAYDFEYAYHRLLRPDFGGRYSDMLYGLENAEAYNRDMRGFILCGLDETFPVSWDVISNENWRGNARGESEYDRKGLDRLSLEELEAVAEEKSLFQWTERVGDAEKQAVLNKLIKHAEAGYPDLWKKARVGIICKNGHELVLKLRSPMPQFPLLLLHYTWFPVPRHSVERNGGMLDRSGRWARPGKAVGNGPFVMSEHRFNEYVKVCKNPLYHKADKVRLNAVKFLPIVNGFTETRMFFDGKLHVSNNVPSEMSDYVRQKAGGMFRQEPYYATIFYRINTTRYPLNDVRVRKALSMALDRSSLVKDVLRGTGERAWGFTPPGAGYDTPRLVRENLDEARRLLADAGFPDGKGFPDLEILTTSREVQKTIAEAIQAMWKKNLNIHIDIKSSEWTAYRQAQNTLKYDMSFSSWSGDYLDPATFLELWMSNSGNNNTGWKNHRFDQMMNKARHSGDMEKRLVFLKEAEQIMLEEAPVIPLGWSRRNYLKRDEVKGWHPLVLDNHILEDIYLEKKEGGND